MRLKQIVQTPWVGAALLAGVVYAVTLGGTYIYDDHGVILEDLRVADSSRWGEFFSGTYNNGVDRLYRPLVSLTYAFQWALHGNQAWAFHLVNWLLHMVASALVAALGTRLLGVAGGWIAGGLFAVHPVHVEAVANIVGRAELMCSIGMLGAMVLLLGRLTIPRAIGIIGCFLLALLSKEQGMLLPALLVVLYWAVGRPAEESIRARRVLVLAICWLTAGYLIWREMWFGFNWNRELLDWVVNPMVTGNLNPHRGSVGADRWLMPLVLLGRYVELLIFPTRLVFDYGGPIIGWQAKSGDPYLWLGVIAVIAWCLAIGLAWWRSRRIVVFLLLGFALMYLVVGNVVSLIGVIFAERLMYIPSIFFVMLVTMLLQRLPRRAMVGIATILIALGAVRSYTYAALWNDELGFYQSMLAKQPGSIRLHMMIVDAHRKAGRLDEAAAVAARGRELLPEYWEIWWQSGVIAMQQKRWDEAKRMFDRSFQMNRDPKVAGWLSKLEQERPAPPSGPLDAIP